MSNSESPKSKYLMIVAVILAGIACYYFIWPTPYEYTRDGETVVRVNRFSGVREYGSESGWNTTKPSKPRMTQAERQKLIWGN